MSKKNSIKVQKENKQPPIENATKEQSENVQSGQLDQQEPCSVSCQETETPVVPNGESAPLENQEENSVKMTESEETHLTYGMPISIEKEAIVSEEEIAAIYKKHGVDRDFGPNHPRWGVPSDMNAFKLLQKEIGEETCL